MNYSFDYNFPANMPHETKNAVRNQLFNMNLEQDANVEFLHTNKDKNEAPCFDIYIDGDYSFSIDSDNDTLYERSHYHTNK